MPNADNDALNGPEFDRPGWYKTSAENGLRPHRFDPGHTGMSETCNALVLRDGYGDYCGLPRDHPAHVIPPGKD